MSLLDPKRGWHPGGTCGPRAIFDGSGIQKGECSCAPAPFWGPSGHFFLENMNLLKPYKTIVFKVFHKCWMAFFGYFFGGGGLGGGNFESRNGNSKNSIFNSFQWFWVHFSCFQRIRLRRCWFWGVGVRRSRFWTLFNHFWVPAPSPLINNSWIYESLMN